MRRLLLIGLATLAIGIVPRPASAQGGLITWIEKLSGPGPFFGAGFELYGLCFGPRKDEPGQSDAETADRDKEWFADVNCGLASRGRDTDRRIRADRVSIGVHYSWLRGDNGLQYDDTVPEEQTDTVTVSRLMGIADIGLIRPLDVGAALGFVRFSGAPAPAFSRIVLEPVRVTLKPLALKPSSTYKDEWLQVRVVMTVIPGGFDAEDFGAIPGTFESGTEVQANLSIIFNLGSAFGR